MKTRNFCVLDIETNGFKPHRDNIWQIAGLKIVDMKIDSIFDSLVKPRGMSQARDFCAFSKRPLEDFQDAAPIDIVADKAYDFFKGDLIYAYHSPFDVSMLVKADRRFERLHYRDYYQVLKNRRPGLQSYKLKDVSKLFKLENKKDGFNAIQDCYVLYNLICKVGL